MLKPEKTDSAFVNIASSIIILLICIWVLIVFIVGVVNTSQWIYYFIKNLIF